MICVIHKWIWQEILRVIFDIFSIGDDKSCGHIIKIL